MTTERSTLVRFTASTLTRADVGGDLPPGICGRVSGVALVYDVVDTYGTVFARGCAKRSIDGKVAARRVPLLMDHERSTEAHVGVIASAMDTGATMVITADLFDTPAGRAALEYVKAVMAADAQTGFSIGFAVRSADIVKMGDKTVDRFLEIELREISITPMPAVPGTAVTGARTDDVDTSDPVRSDVALLARAARLTLAAMPDADRAAVLAEFAGSPQMAHTDGAADTAPLPVPPANERRDVSMTERLAAVRSSYITHKGTR